MEDKEKAKDLQCPKRLNFNLPLLSTKRQQYYGYGEKTLEEESWCGNKAKFQGPSDEDERNRIPFSWEQAPGKPKNVEKKTEDGVLQVVETPRPRPPPCRWQQQQQQQHYCGLVENVVENQQVLPKQQAAAEEEIIFSSSSDDNDIEDYADILDHHRRISCCGDDEEDDQQDNFTDAMDVFSLSEAIDILERTRKVDEKVVVDNCNELRNRVLECRGITSPSFIINRFLPDASAIAASSALSFATSKNKINNKKKQQHGIIISNNTTSSSSSCCTYSSSNKSKSKVCDIRGITRSQDSPKGCGMENLLPWRMKHKLCGIKSPVITQRPSSHHSSNKN